MKLESVIYSLHTGVSYPIHPHRVDFNCIEEIIRDLHDFIINEHDRVFAFTSNNRCILVTNDSYTVVYTGQLIPKHF